MLQKVPTTYGLPLNFMGEVGNRAQDKTLNFMYRPTITLYRRSIAGSYFRSCSVPFARLLHIIRNQRQNDRAVRHGVRAAATHLARLQIARAGAAVSRRIVCHCSALGCARACAEIVVVVVDAFCDAVGVACAGWVGGWWGWAVLVAEEVGDVHAWLQRKYFSACCGELDSGWCWAYLGSPGRHSCRMMIHLGSY